MAFKKLLASLGAGGASVETVLTEENVVPGGVVQGEVRIQGGSVDQQIEGLSVGLQAKVEVESGDQEYKQNIEFATQRLGGAFELKAGAVHAVPFGLEIPWETPVTMIDGQSLRGMQIGVRTELQIARAVDSGDLDPVNVHPLPAQKAILDAFIQLGFRFKDADMERGHIRGTRQRLPFYQEIEFYPPQQYRGLNQVELSFVADDHEMDVVLEMDKKPGLFSEGSDTYRAFRVGLHDFHTTDWSAYLHQWVSEVGSKRNWF
ncbi:MULTISPECIES: sporulation protein [Streptomyces]|jgi:sporulation-control protein|uniref:Secreted protein n=4 Tax=Streptomyces TaxID=1883 RepID=F3NQQ3_9ACTN|nr:MULTISPECIES: sporulation protein [Streptomyces]EGG43887.1 secreted protein [Streptomyces griseoaurantiacus M045]MBA5222075.1 sporulation protein [Streptomyces griseoaurantiacus]MCF0090463.1 Sporulation-control protein spo0M [Streptomyces sp. MH192]MCF0102796.1 Sporulation-control protein spo0M [Streptomyces sp. MH191]MDX3092721.1 sporulation protein [Streptomyces sp. ME12-02E]